MFRAIGKLLHWIWSGLDGLRKVLHLVLLLVLFGTLWAAFSRSIPLVPDKAALVIAKSNRGLNSSFTVRKISHGEGVERVFQTYSPALGAITVKRRGNVRRAKLYFLRERTGKAARIEEKV